MVQDNNSNITLKNTPIVFRIGKQSLIFATTDISKNNLPIFEHYTVKSGISMAANLREAFKESALLSNSFNRAKALIDTPVILIPTEEFVETDADMLFRYAYSGAENCEVTSFLVPELNCVALFEVNKDLKLVLNDNILDVKFVPAIYPLWKYVHNNFFSIRRQHLFVAFNGKTINVFCFNKNRFKFSNTFNVEHPNDVVYYVMHVWKLLGLNNDNDKIFLFGNVDNKQWYVDNLTKYVKKIEVANIEEKLIEDNLGNANNVPFDLITYFIK